MFVRTLVLLALVAYAQCEFPKQCDSDKYGDTYGGYQKTLAPVKVPHFGMKVKVLLDKKDLCPVYTNHVGTSVKVCIAGVGEVPLVKLVNIKTAYVYRSLFGKPATLQFTVYCKGLFSDNEER